MNKNLLFYLIIFICSLLLVLSIFFPNILSWLVVIIFISLISKLCFDGIQTRRDMLDNQKLDRIIKTLNSDLDSALRKFSPNQLYKINKLSLLDKIFRENQELQIWEKNQRYYHNLPNLLLAFGLLGTFVGITINLFLLSRNTGGEIPLDETLEDIIGSMAIAFISSLAALVSSVIIAKFYPGYDLELCKNNLFNQLEYYLENECHILLNLPSIQEKIDELIQSLLNLPQSIKELEKSVSVSSQNLFTSSKGFQSKTEDAGNIIKKSSHVLNDATSNLVKVTQDFSNFSSTLKTSTVSLEGASTALASYTENLQTLINDLNNNSSRIQNLIKSNQNELSNVSLRLEENGNSLLSSTQTFNINASQVKEALNNHTGQVSIHNYNLQQLSIQIVNNSQILQQINQDLQNIVNAFKAQN
ncbi:hypothetical protein IQ247_08500 [Plectonema cf. radiosum LEGE 06105]|uniref:MotA/TolQ/ExbB proton channel domain-containing protein n=1 Tax=Plectonema cf. radiosum LEGE 06105 TaxID=945769 RepID=A0A8J7F172_9CYAN|nr:hypothetical protein [Plectonema radiosum]MBE9212730.1 hypothetical protein [Plectonema cf. radiosum LEGE 06105]